MRSHLTDLLDACERRGRLNLRTADIADHLPNVGAEALRQALQRQQKKGRIVRTSRGSEHWIIVPHQDAAIGAPPLEVWLDTYLSRALGIPYYVGLLSAAEAYGVSPQAVMVTQVMASGARRPVQVGRNLLVFHKRVRVAEMPTQWYETPVGRFRISTPALTAIELVSRQDLAGGISRVAEVVQGLAPSIRTKGLAEALNAVGEVPAAQRLGALLARAGQSALAGRVRNWLNDKRTRNIALTPGDSAETPVTLDAQFNVFVPDEFPNANS